MGVLMFGRRAGLIAAGIVAVLAIGSGILLSAPSGSAATSPVQTIFGSVIPAKPDTTDDQAKVELGLQFKARVSGQVTAIRFYKGWHNTGQHIGHVYSSAGDLMASVTFTGETASGWQSASLAHPATLRAGSTYTVSYLAPRGNYASADTYVYPHVSGDLTALKGTFRYGGGYPRDQWQTSNYYVDVSFVASQVPTTTMPVSSSTTTTRSTVTSNTVASSTTAPVTTSTSTTPGLPAGVTLQPVDGGNNYYSKWATNTLPTASSYFPLGVWMEQGPNASKLQAYGFNMMVNPVVSPGAGIANLDILGDEYDMYFGPGNAAWDEGNFKCVTAGTECGFTAMQAVQPTTPSTLRYANYGKGVSFWESNTDAAKFINLYQDVVSVDLYWATDSDLCSQYQGGQMLGYNRDLTQTECRAPSNYGRTVDRVRSLESPVGSKPIFNFVELGHPGTNGLQIPVAKIKPAVWSSLIHGARGIVYFNHSFGGSCQSQHVVFDCDPTIGQAVTAINAQVKSLAPVLNSPTANGYAAVAGAVDISAKYSNGSFYLFTDSTQATSHTATFTVKSGSKATVIGENRSVPIVSGKFTDTFADGNAVHLYQIS